MKLFNLFKKKKKPVDSLMWFDVNMATVDTALKIMYNKGYDKGREKKQKKLMQSSVYELIKNEQELDTWIREYMGVKKK